MSDEITLDNWNTPIRFGKVVPFTGSQDTGKGTRPEGKPAFLPFSDLKASIDVADFVEGTLIEASMFVIYGESNCGKTFFMLDMALHVALGWEWRGKEVEQGAVVYCALEGSHGIRNRVAAFKAEHKLGDDVDAPFVVVPYGLDMLRDEGGDTDQIIAVIKEVAETYDMPVKLVVIDTLARAMSGGNENASEDMGALVRNTDRIREETKACCGYIHHSGKDAAKGARGHSSLRAATDTEIEITRDSPDMPARARIAKQREMATEDEFDFTLKVVGLGTNRRGKLVTSCVVEPPGGDAPQRQARPSALTGHNLQAMSALIEAVDRHGVIGAEGVPLGIRSISVEQWRAVFYSRSMVDAKPTTKKMTFRRCADALVNKRLACKEEDRVWIVRADQEQAGL